MTTSTETTESPTLQRALSLVRHGYSVIPVGAGESGKAPLIPSWEEFSSQRKNGEPGRNPTKEEVNRWWTDIPTAKLAIVGGWHNLVAIDIDDLELAKQLKERFKNHAPLVETPSGGLHIYVQEEEQSRSGPLIPGVIDIKGAGGYFIAPPSPGYKKLNEVIEPLAIPTSARDYTTDLISGLGYEVKANKEQTVSAVYSSVKEIPSGSRNETLASVAGTLRNRGLDEETIEAALQVINQKKSQPPLPEAEVSKIAKSIARYEPSTTDDWFSLLPFDEYDLPPFPLEILPINIREWVQEEARATQTPPDLAGMLSLAVISTVSQRKLEVQIKQNYAEPLSIYSVTGLDPGNRKSAVFRDATKIIYEYEHAIAKEMKDAIAASRTRYEIMEQTLERAKKIAAKAKPEEKELKIREAEEIAIELAKMVPLVAPRYVVDDTTTEKLVSVMCEQDEHIAMLSAESDIHMVMAGRYNRGEPNFNIYLKGHAGDPHRVDRMGRQGNLQRPALTLALTVQPSVLKEFSKTPQFVDRGLLARILFSIPKSTVGARNIKQAPVSAAITAGYNNVITRLLEIPLERDKQGNIITHYLQFSPEARAVIDEYAIALEPQLGPYGELADIANWASKLVGAIGRLSALLHLGEYYLQEMPWLLPITDETVYKAIVLAEYLTEHAKAAHGYMNSDPIVEHAKYLVGWLRKLGKHSLTKTELYRATHGKLKTIADLDPPLNLLTEHGYLRLKETPLVTRPGRKPSPTYEVNPEVFKLDYPKPSIIPPEDSSHSNHQIEVDEKSEKENPNLLKDVVEVIKLNEPVPERKATQSAPASDSPPSFITERKPLFPKFPLYGKEHQHEFALVTDIAGTFNRCKHCGEFPSSLAKEG